MKIFLSILTTLCSFLVFAQLQTSGGMSASQLVQDVLLGEGVDVMNIHYSGASEAIGTFNSTNANVGIAEGIIMTTGTINSNAQGPIGPNNSPEAGKDNNYPGYSQLSNLVGASTYNAAVLEFDFIPYSDTVRFKYVFASEEYPEWVGSQYNDVFAFFISGPGIPGGTQNMAIIPNTNMAVAINNVNSGLNSMYYRANGDGNQSPYNSNPYYIQYDGFTKPLEAVSKVQCGEKYHLTIAIADVGDAKWDSGIFLQKNSLESLQPVQVSYHLLDDPYGDGKTMAQNCSSAEVIITRSGPKVNQPLTIPINILGDAIEGIDYSSIPSSIHFAAGQTSISFTIDALNNPNLTGIVTLLLEFLIEDPCGNEEYQIVELYIKPVDPVQVTVQDVEKDCPDEEVTLVATALGGGGNYTYLWSNGATTQSITVNPSSTQTYTVSVTDDCLEETATASAKVTVPVLSPLTIHVPNDIVDDCPFIRYDLFVEAQGGSGVYSYQWINEQGKVISLDPTVEVQPSRTTFYTVYVSDKCGEIDSATINITITSPPLVLDISPDIQVCPNDSVLLTVEASGGFGDYYYYWPQLGDSSQSVWVNPSETTRYDVIVKDDCQTFQVSAYTTVSVRKPTADFEIITKPIFNGIPLTFENQSKDANDYVWNFGDGHISTVVHPNNTYDESGTYVITLIAIDRNGCRDTINKKIRIEEEFYLYVPNTFTAGAIGTVNESFRVSAIGIDQFDIKIYNRWGELLFESQDVNFSWSGDYGGQVARDGTYVWKITYTTLNSDEEQYLVGHVNIIQ